MRAGLILILFITVFCLFHSCNKDDSPLNNHDFYFLEVPEGFPLPDIPEDNQLSKSRIALGKKLFYDPILSIDSSISCASCHSPTTFFVDTTALSSGVNEVVGSRNSISLANVAYQPYFMRDGGVPTLEMQVGVPIQEHSEFNHNIVDIGEKLKQIPEYVSMSQKAYDRVPDPFVITRSIAAFERIMISGNSNYDQVIFQGTNEFTSSELRGYNLFNSDSLNCTQCHSGFNFTNYEFENTGLYEIYADSGRARITNLPEDRAKFKVPSLRNVAHTFPYMHNGSKQTLAQVIEHYKSGGKPHPNKSELIQGFTLTAEDQEDLINFLKSLTDHSFIENRELLN